MTYNSPLSNFVRNASHAEQRRVYERVMAGVEKRQREVLTRALKR